MELFPAYKWFSIRNGVQFERAMSSLFRDFPLFRKQPFDELNNKVFHSAITKHEENVSMGTCSKRSKDTLKKSLKNLSHSIQERERVIAHIANCLMNCFYPSVRLKPSEFNQEINQAIIDLERAKKSVDKLDKYNGLFFRTTISNDQTIQNEIDLLQAVRENKMFPVQRVNEQHFMRMFVVAITKKFLNEGHLKKGSSGYEFRDILKFNNELLGFECFDKPMSEVNVRKAMNDELDRYLKDEVIYKNHQNTEINAKKQKKQPVNVNR